MPVVARTWDRFDFGTFLDKFPSRFQLSARQPELRFNPTLHHLLSCFLHPLSFLLAGKRTFVLECSIKACIPQACVQVCRTRSMYSKRYSSKHSCITVHRHLFWKRDFVACCQTPSASAACSIVFASLMWLCLSLFESVCVSLLDSLIVLFAHLVSWFVGYLVD